MKTLFDQVSVQCSKLTTRTYSTSFSLGIYFLNSHLRNPIYAIYGFVRFADEIVDSFEAYDRKALLQKFRMETYEAIEDRISLNPILNAFQAVVHDYAIDQSLIETFLQSMEMDLEQICYSRDTYEKYILGSAEVVGLMCLSVFTGGNKQQYEKLRPAAMKLGSAFQKVNFLRDLKADYQDLGRLYFPNVDMTKFSSAAKKEIEQEIEQDFAEALEGIRNLPSSSKHGVFLAYIYYRSLLKKIRKTPAQHILNTRIRISNSEKFGLMLNSMFQYKLNLL
jgi:phytoene synthase